MEPPPLGKAEEVIVLIVEHAPSPPLFFVLPSPSAAATRAKPSPPPLLLLLLVKNDRAMAETLPATEAIIELAPNVLPDGGRDDAEDDESGVLLRGVVREGGAEEEAFAAMHGMHFAKSLFFFHCVLLKLSFGNSALQLVQMRVGAAAMSFSVAAAGGGGGDITHTLSLSLDGRCNLLVGGFY
jgi:hypothetical protein